MCIDSARKSTSNRSDLEDKREEKLKLWPEEFFFETFAVLYSTETVLSSVQLPHGICTVRYSTVAIMSFVP